MDSIEYAERGRRLKILRHNGRPADPTEEEEAALLQALEALKIPSMQEGGLKDYLAVCKHTGLSARTVWTFGASGLGQGAALPAGGRLTSLGRVP